ncbi:hypothetical protein J6590_068095 [Homalodisca vitripennis]|nr:hypothetical protein J6590_068095 [Homalodisca vitripennis]
MEGDEFPNLLPPPVSPVTKNCIAPAVDRKTTVYGGYTYRLFRSDPTLVREVSGLSRRNHGRQMRQARVLRPIMLHLSIRYRCTPCPGLMNKRINCGIHRCSIRESTTEYPSTRSRDLADAVHNQPVAEPRPIVSACCHKTMSCFLADPASANVSYC